MSQRTQTELVIVDRAVTDWQALLGDVVGRSRVCIIGAGDSLLDVLDRELAQVQICALHLVGHGRPGAITLGDSEIDAAWLNTYQHRFEAVVDSLAGADILLYGCQTARGAQGTDLIQKLAHLTGAAVAASSQDVGRNGQGQNWTLDVIAGGDPMAGVIFSQSLQDCYAASFATVTFSIDPPFVVEDEPSSTTFSFNLDTAPAPGEFVSVWLYATPVGQPTTLSNAIAGFNAEFNQFNVFTAFNNPVGIPLTAEVNGVPAYDPDVSVEAGVSTVPDFGVFELRLTQLENSITLDGFNDFVDDGPRTVNWNLIDDPNDAQGNSIVNPTILFTEVDTRSELPPTNGDPMAVNDTASTLVGTAVSIDVLANDSDPDSDALLLAEVGQGANGSVEIVDGEAVYTPDAGFSGTDTFTYTVSDGGGGEDTGTVNVTVSEPAGPPVVGFAVDKTTLVESLEGGGLDTLTFTFTTENLPADGVIVSLATYRPGDPDDETIKFGIADFALFGETAPGGGLVQPTFDGVELVGGWQENDGITFRITAETATVTLPLSADDPDRAPGDTGFTRNNDVGVEQVEWRLVDFDRLNPGLPGPDDFVVADGSGSAVVTLKDEAGQTYEAGDDRITTAGRAVEIDVLANDNGGVEIVSVEDPAVSNQGLLQNGTVAIDDNGTPGDTTDDTLIYTPDPGFVGRDVFAYLVRNADGELDQARVTVDVTEFQNAEPDAADDGATTAFQTSVTIDVVANDDDPDGDPLTVESVTQGANGAVAIDADGRVTYTPNDAFSGEDTFTYTVSDGQEGTDTATVTVTVAPAENAPPSAADDTATTGLDTAVSIDVLANDDDADGDPLTLASVTQGANGAVVIDDGGTAGNPSDDTITYTPDDGFSGEDTFTYTVADGEGGEDTASVTVTVQGAQNTPPSASDDTAVTPFETAVTIDALANDADADDDPLTLASVTQGANGSVTIDDGGTASDPSDDRLIYTPNAGFSGEDSFTYVLSDGAGGEDTATVSVTVDALLDDPDPIIGGDGPDDLAGTDANDRMEGGAGDDSLAGCAGDDEIDGGDGNDILSGDAGDDMLLGGGGIDRAAYSGAFGNYILSFDGAGAAIEITDKRADGTGADSIESVELVQFSDGFSFGGDGVFDLRQITGTASLAEDDLMALVEMYVAYFNRAPDALGLLYWGTRLSEELTLGEIAQSFFDQPETRGLYDFLGDTPLGEVVLTQEDAGTLVDGIYANLLERAPDDEGREYWIEALVTGRVNLGESVLAIINGAKAPSGDPADAQTVAEKSALGLSFAVDNGMTDVDNGETVMDAYDVADRSESIAAAEALIAQFRDAAGQEGSDEIIVELVGLGQDPLGIA
ncbi:MAG: Ig-like domain-containing protein [Pseudomonadota bacterium]